MILVTWTEIMYKILIETRYTCLTLEPTKYTWLKWGKMRWEKLFE